MPYKVIDNCVHKMNPDGSMGKKMGCHGSKSEAMAQMRALYASEGDKKEIEAIDAELKEMGLDTKEIEQLTAKCGMGMGYVPWGVKSFAELDAWKQAQEIAHEVGENTMTFGSLVQNVMADPEWGMNEKVAAVKELADEFASRVSEPEMDDMKEVAESDEDFVELLDDPEAVEAQDGDEKAKRADVTPADKKRAVAEYGSVTFADPTNKKYPIDTEAHIRAAWNYIGQAKNAAKYPDKGAAIKRKIVAAWKRKIDKNGPPSAKKELEDSLVERVLAKVKELFGLSTIDKEQPGFMVYKEADGSTRWIARYSNHYRDQDNPPEIISSQSHKQFTEKVEKGLAPLPELWIWHVKDWNIGEADWVAWDDAGFALAGGHPRQGMEPVFDQLSTLKEVRVSHGMPRSTIVRDSLDPTIIIEHETREISVLPAWAAANPLTGFVIINTENKEADMAISKEQKEEMVKKWGLSPETIQIIEAANVKDAKKAKDEGLESKDKETPTAPVATEPVATEPEKVEETPAVPELSAEAKQLKEIFDGFTAQLKSLSDKVVALEGKQADEQKAKTEAVKSALSQTPIASILSMFEKQSAIGSEETAVDGRTSLAKSKPAEAKPAVEGRTLVPFINDLLAGSNKPAGQQQ